MSQSDRFIVIQRLLGTGHGVSRQRLLRDLEVSPATLKRDIAKLRDQLGWPITWDPDLEGWRLDKTAPPGDPMPGLRLSADEAAALLTMQHLLEQMDMGGMLAQQLRPLAARLDKLARRVGRDAGRGPIDIRRHLRLADVGTRKVSLPCFQTLAGALLARRRLHITHRARGRDDHGLGEREVSPQRLIHYRGNWYLDAWCHTREALRSFAVDAIESATVIADRAAIEMAEEALDDTLGAGYGIFAGAPLQWATLRFSPERSRWVSRETWHPAQQGAFDDQGRWTLRLPYADPRELLMDILRHVPDVQVLAPAALAQELLDKLKLGIRTVAPGSHPEPGNPEDSGMQ